MASNLKRVTVKMEFDDGTIEEVIAIDIIFECSFTSAPYDIVEFEEHGTRFLRHKRMEKPERISFSVAGLRE
jgi:hypothetical protein